MNLIYEDVKFYYSYCGNCGNKKLLIYILSDIILCLIFVFLIFNLWFNDLDLNYYLDNWNNNLYSVN